MSLRGYDEWLEAPYGDAERRQERFEDWCEREGFDPTDDAAWERFDAEGDEWDEP